MTTNKKVIFIVTIMLILLSLSNIINVTLNLKDFGIKNSIEKSNSIAEAVRDGLTAHMINGAMKNKELFLENMSKHQNVKNLRVLRSQSVIDQFPTNENNSYVYNEMEKQVLESRKSITKVAENSKNLVMNVTIPYIATSHSTPNCLSCHTNVKEGDVLGIISMDVDLDSVKEEGIAIITKIIAITLTFLIIAIFTARHFIRAYVKLFEDLELGIDKAYKGDFSYKVTTNLSDDAGKVAKRLNELSDIFRFKKTIELDATKQDIYNRLAHILINHLNIKNFIIFEINDIKKEKKAVYKTEYKWNDSILNSNISMCRAYRTSSEVYSTEFYKICESCFCENIEMICLPFTINDNYSLLLHIRCESKEEVEIIKESIAIIKNYFDIAQPVLESKLLMNILKDSSLKDALTGLYNRRYLDEFIDEIHDSSKTFSILMADIDYFKQINDKYGHDMGDKVLKGIADILRANIKGSDLAIRFGGEEFLIMLFNITPENAMKKADEIRIEFSNKIFKNSEESFSKTLSIGVAHYPTQGTSIWHSIKYADVALYEAKNSGRNKVIEFKEEMFPQEQY